MYSQYSKATFILSDFPIQIRESKFPLRLTPCPFGVICSYWEHLAGFPKRSPNPFRLLLHSDMYQLIRHFFESIASKKSGSFLVTYLHYTTAGSCTSYDKKSFPLVMNFYLPLLISSWHWAIQKWKGAAPPYADTPDPTDGLSAIPCMATLLLFLHAS